MIIGTLLASLALGGVALATSSSTVDSIEWTGQGTSGGDLTNSLCGESADYGGITQLPPGADGNHHLLWIFTVGNGNTVSEATLTTNGDTTTWSTDPWTTSSGNQIKFITKAYDLSTLTASVSWVGDLGSGNHNLVISHGCAGKAQPEISTEASATGEGVTGDTLNDTAHLSGGTTSPPISGTITFKLYSGTDTACSTSLYSEDVTVDGNGDYSTATGFIAQTKGTYQWVASYRRRRQRARHHLV